MHFNVKRFPYSRIRRCYTITPSVFSYGFIFLALVLMVLFPRSFLISKRFTAVCMHLHDGSPAHVVVVVFLCKVNGVIAADFHSGRG